VPTAASPFVPWDDAVAGFIRHLSSAAARSFTSWCLRRGLIDVDPGERLASPQVARVLPTVLGVDEAVALMEHAAVAADDGSVLGCRDRAILELLYGTGIRVAELCGLDLDGVDRLERTIRVRGKGDRERTVPYGGPAAKALDDWWDRRLEVANQVSGRALFLGARGRRIDPRTVRGAVHRLSRQAGVPEVAPHALRHSAATHVLEGGHLCAGPSARSHGVRRIPVIGLSTDGRRNRASGSR